MNDHEQVVEFIEELGAGVFAQKVAATLREAALGAVTNGDKKKGSKVTLEFSLKPFNEDGDQVFITHKISKSIPTKRGKKSEEDTTESVMFVHPKGVMSVDAPAVDRNGQASIMELRKQ